MWTILQSDYIHEIPYPLEKQDERKTIVKECRAKFSDSDLYDLHKHPLVDEWRVHDMWVAGGILPSSPNYLAPGETIISFDYHFYILGAFMDQRFEIGNREDFLKLKDVLLMAVTSEFTPRKKIFFSVRKNIIIKGNCKNININISLFK